MKTLNQILLSIILLFLTIQIANADVKLPRIFSSNMVFQQGIEIPVWGWADINEEVTVNINHSSVRTVADSEGKWKIKLPVQEYGGPYEMIIKGKNRIVFENVMIGDIWVCSGQANMEWPVNKSNNAEEEVISANYPEIRLFNIPETVAQFPEDDISSGEWVTCLPETVKDFSAVAYFFGRDLYNELDVPVGLILASWGGTVIESWTSGETISNDADFRKMLIELQQLNVEKYKEEKLKQVKEILDSEYPIDDTVMADKNPLWSSLDFDDMGWQTIKTPKFWEQQGYLDIDGIGWYRKEIQLTEEQSKSNITLNLGRIDDSYLTFLNGIEIERTNDNWNQEQIYTVDQKYIKPGKNMIVVRVNDTGDNGGIWDDQKEQYIAIQNEKIDHSGNWKFKISKASISSVNFGPNSYPTLIFNGMINPLVPFGIKGVIWYQGESNVGRAKQYQRLFPNLIKDWRQHWNLGNFPFLFVSLANYTQPDSQPSESEWAELREAQTQALSLPNTGMAVTIDIGNATDIHPKNKQDVGKLLAINALKIAYQKNVVSSGPLFDSVEFKDGKAYISFSGTDSGLVVRDKYGYIKGFTIAGADKKFHWAKAELTGNKTVTVYSDDVKNPVAVRYGWANNPDDLNLYNKEGLPANPFRTDNWEETAK